jgi:hypothetical protein
MNLKSLRSAVVIVSFLAATAVFAAPPATTATAGSLTVGEFAVKLADALNTTGRDIATIEDAKTFFAGRGMSIPSDMNLSAALTQSDVSRLASLFGVSVSADKPAETFDAASADNFVTYLREEISATPEASQSTDPLTATAEKGKNTAAIGACCVSGTCVVLGPQACALAGGVFKGSLITCTPDPCAAGMGTCCLGKLGPCVFSLPQDCQAPSRFRGTQVCTRKTCSREPESPSQP